MPEKNGSWRTYALGVAVALCGALGSAVLASVQDDVKQLQIDSSLRAQRIAATEAKMIDMKETVERIERKVDILIERGSHR